MIIDFCLNWTMMHFDPDYNFDWISSLLALLCCWTVYGVNRNYKLIWTLCF